MSTTPRVSLTTVSVLRTVLDASPPGGYRWWPLPCNQRRASNRARRDRIVLQCQGASDVWNITLRNMQFRARQLLLAIVGTALVFAMALLVTGLKEAFKTEGDRVVESIGGDAWVLPAGAARPFTGFTPMQAADADRIGAVPGVRRASPVLLIQQNLQKGADIKQFVVVGHKIGGLGEPPPEEGRRSHRPGEVVADRKLGFDLGEKF